jgi:hypothetical protein
MLTDTTTAVPDDKIRCDACPVMCYIRPGAAGACDRCQSNGELVRVDPRVVLEQTVSHGGRLVPFQAGGVGTARWFASRTSCHGDRRRHDLSGLQAGAVHRLSEIDGVDMVTVVTEGIFSYCGVKVKIGPTAISAGDRDGRAQARRSVTSRPANTARRCCRSAAFIISPRLQERGPRHLRRAMDLSNCRPVELTIDGGATVVVRAGYPHVNGVAEERMRVGCGSATSACSPSSGTARSMKSSWGRPHHRCFVEHQAGKLLDIADTRIR